MLEVTGNKYLPELQYYLGDFNARLSIVKLHAQLVPDHGVRDNGFAEDPINLNTNFSSPEADKKWRAPPEAPSPNAEYDAQSQKQPVFDGARQVEKSAEIQFKDIGRFLNEELRAQTDGNGEFLFPGFTLKQFDSPINGKLAERVADGFATAVVRESRLFQGLGPEKCALACELIKRRVLGRPDLDPR